MKGEFEGAAGTPCRSVREELLAADPEELRGERETELSRHLAGCASCREVAETILAAHALMDARLGRGGGGPRVAAILSRAAAGSASATAAAAAPVAPERWKGVARWAVPLALAAGLAGILVLESGRRGTPPLEDPPPQAARHEGPSRGFQELDLEVPAGTDAAVLDTGNPDITVIWFMGGDR